MSTLQKQKVNYIIWQNRATDFYLGARLLYLHKIYSSAVFGSIQALEALLKATLIYWDNSFDPEKARHKIAPMLRTVRNKVKGAKDFRCPDYFYSDQRYQKVSRYPVRNKGLLIPQTFLTDLDKAFVDLIALVPFQFNSELISVLSDGNNRLKILKRKNKEISRLRKVLGGLS